MICVKKGETITEILEVFKDKYLNAGWKVIEKPKQEETDEAVNIIMNSLNSKTSANSRLRNQVANKQAEANAIVATELNKKPNSHFTDGLIKE